MKIRSLNLMFETFLLKYAQYTLLSVNDAHLFISIQHLRTVLHIVKKIIQLISVS